MRQHRYCFIANIWRLVRSGVEVFSAPCNIWSSASFAAKLIYLLLFLVKWLPPEVFEACLDARRMRRDAVRRMPQPHGGFGVPLEPRAQVPRCADSSGIDRGMSGQRVHTWRDQDRETVVQ